MRAAGCRCGDIDGGQPGGWRTQCDESDGHNRVGLWAGAENRGRGSLDRRGRSRWKF